VTALPFIAIALGLSTFITCLSLVWALDERVGHWIAIWQRESALGRLRRIGRYLIQTPVPDALINRWVKRSTDAEMDASGLPWSASAFAGLRWISLLAGIYLIAVLLLMGGAGVLTIFVATGIALLAGTGPSVWLKLRTDRRQREIHRSLPDFLDRFVLALEAGLGFELALQRSSSSTGGLLGSELRKLARILGLGKARSEALAELSRRVRSPELRAFCASIQRAETLGTPLAGTLRVQSELLRSRRRRRAQEAGRRMPILIVFPLVFFFLPSLLIIYLAPPLLHLFLSP
jgi:tight adherence protein C